MAFSIINNCLKCCCCCCFDKKPQYKKEENIKLNTNEEEMIRRLSRFYQDNIKLNKKQEERIQRLFRFCIQQNIDGGYTLPQLAAMRGGLMKGDVQYLKRLEYDFCEVDKVVYQNTPLIWAIANAKFNCAKIIAEEAPESVNIRSLNQKNYPLHLCVGKNYTNRSYDSKELKISSLYLAKVLLQNGAHINAKDRLGNTPLHYACLQRNYEMIRFLLNYNADSQSVNKDGKKPQDLLNETYKNANKILSDEAHVYFLDRSTFNNHSYRQCKSLFSG